MPFGCHLLSPGATQFPPSPAAHHSASSFIAARRLAVAFWRGEPLHRAAFCIISGSATFLDRLETRAMVANGI